ncbi:MAG TPA: hypothetical protein VLF93_01340 [Candidatus Saccharimonadales bacterium]|nr:hypothetical protein [Candidatus Saccharimonadales bacterium]
MSRAKDAPQYVPHDATGSVSGFQDNPTISRRNLLRGLAGVGTLAVLAACGTDSRNSSGVTAIPGTRKPDTSASPATTPASLQPTQEVGNSSPVPIIETFGKPDVTEEITVNPGDGAVIVNASREHPSVVVVNARTPGENKTFRWRPAGKDVPWQTVNRDSNPDVATVLLTSVGIEVDTREDRGFWTKTSEQTPNDGTAEVPSREQDSFKTPPKSLTVTEIIVDDDGKGYSKRNIPQGTDPYHDYIPPKHFVF